LGDTGQHFSAKPKKTKFKVGKKYNVKGFPTLLYFEDGAMKSEYNSGRAEDDLVKFFLSGSAAKKDEL